MEIAEGEEIEPSQTSFLKGLILLKLGKNTEAINSFEQAKSIDDKLILSANYQIAVAKLQEGKLTEAKEMFNEIVIRDPNADIAQFANQYVDAITKRLEQERPFRLTADIQYQYDSNVILKPGDVTAAGAGDITGEADSAGIAMVRAEYVPKLNGPYGFNTQYSFYQNLHSNLKNYDVQSHSVALVPSYKLRDSSISLLGSYNYTLVAGDKYL